MSEEALQIAVNRREKMKSLSCVQLFATPWTEVCDIVQETGIKAILMEKKCKKSKWLSGEALQIAVKRRDVKSNGKRIDVSI